jgi:hypothetical protein
VSEIMRPRDMGFVRELHRWHPSLPILIFSIHDEAIYGAPPVAGRSAVCPARAQSVRRSGRSSPGCLGHFPVRRAEPR